MTQVIDVEAMEMRARVLGVLLRSARDSAGKSVRDLAQALGCSEERVRAYEFGERSLTLPELELAAPCLGVPLGNFFDEPMSPVHSDQIGEPQLIIAVRQRIIGALLQRARMEAHATLHTVAQAVGITEHLLRRYELGERPVPLPLLEALALELDVDLDYFRDGSPEDIQESDSDEQAFRRFMDLPPEVRDFVLTPINLSYLQVAMNLSTLPAERLRAIAEGLLDITY